MINANMINVKINIDTGQAKIVTEDGFSVSLLGEQTWPPKFVDVKYWSEGRFEVNIVNNKEQNAKNVGEDK